MTDDRANLRPTRPKTGIKGILGITKFGKLSKTRVFKISISLAVVLVSTSILFELDPYNLILVIKDDIITFLPSILGFTIGGYALVVGFVQGGMLERITDKIPNSNHSLYQGMSSVFALNIVAQAIALIFAYGVRYVVFIDTSANFLYVGNSLRTMINWVTLLVIAFLFSLSLFLVIQIVINIFDFSQLHQYLIEVEKRNKGQKDMLEQDSFENAKKKKKKNKK